MALRGTLYRCHLFSFAGPQTEGVTSLWTQSLEPIGEREVLDGTLVELYARFDGAQAPFSAESRLRFDILEEDFLLTGGSDDKVDSLMSNGAPPPEDGFQVLQRDMNYVALGANESVTDYLEYLRGTRAPDYRERIFLIEELGEEPGDPPVFHVLGFWIAERREDYANSEFYFILHVDGALDDATTQVLNVTPEGVPTPRPGAELMDIPVLVPRDSWLEQEAAADIELEFEREHEILQSGWSAPEAPIPSPGSPPTEASRPAAHRRVTTPLPPPPPPVRPSIEAQEVEWPWAHAEGSVDQDKVIAGASPFDGNLVAIFRPWDTLLLTSRRYVVSTEFNRAIRWGQLLFGARAFVVIEGPIGGSSSPVYFTVRSDRFFALGTLQTIELADGSDFVGVDIRHWEMEQRDDQGASYIVRLIGTTDDAIIIPSVRIHAHETCAQLLGGCPFQSHLLADVIPPDRAAREIFTEVDMAVRHNQNEGVVRMLVDLNHHAFALASAEARGTYVGLLLEALTLWQRIIGADRIETAILEVICSVSTVEELSDVIAELHRRDQVSLLIGRMDQKLWELLIDIGKRLGGAKSISIDFQFLLAVFRESIGGSGPLLPSGFFIPIPADDVLTWGVPTLEPLYAAANSFLRFGRESVVGVWTLLSKPDQVLKGIWAVVKAGAMVGLAAQGWAPGIQFVEEELLPALRRAAESLVYAWKGVQILRDSLGSEGAQLVMDITQRIKWAIIWEVASMFIGVGEVVAAARTVSRGVEGAAGLMRLSRVVGVGDEAISKIDDFASLAARSGIVDAERALRTVAELPADDIRLLQRTLADVEPRELRTLDQLGELVGTGGRRAVDQIAARIDALNVMEARFPGILAGEGAEAFRRLTNLPGATDERMIQVLTSLNRDEMSRLVQTVMQLSDEATTRGATIISTDLVAEIARREASFNHLMREGFSTFSSVLRQSGNNLRLVERNLDALNLLRRQLRSDVERANLTSRLMAGEATALRDLQTARHTLEVMKGRCAF